MVQNSQAVHVKTALITGGASGIGAAISLTLAEEGAIPVILGKSPMSAEFVEQLQARTAQHLFLQVELSDDAACRAAVEQTVARFGRIDGLVNNAGGSPAAERHSQFSSACPPVRDRVPRGAAGCRRRPSARRSAGR